MASPAALTLGYQAMTEPQEPKKQLETTRGGSGRKGKTAVGLGDGEGGGGESFDRGTSGAHEPPREGRHKAIVCDRKQLIRDGWKAMLRPVADVIDETGDGKAAMAMIESERPDLIVLDVDLDRINGLEVCKWMANEFRSVVATDSHNATKYFHQLIRFGVVAIVLKKSGPAALMDAFRLGVRSAPFIDPKIAPLLQQRPTMSSTTLTDRDHEVLIRLSLQNEEIASELDMKPSTVEKFVEAILAKLEVSTRTAATLKAQQLGYIPLPVVLRPRTQDGLTEEDVEAERHARQAIQ